MKVDTGIQAWMVLLSFTIILPLIFIVEIVRNVAVSIFLILAVLCLLAHIPNHRDTKANKLSALLGELREVWGDYSEGPISPTYRQYSRDLAQKILFLLPDSVTVFRYTTHLEAYCPEYTAWELDPKEVWSRYDVSEYITRLRLGKSD